MGWMPPPESECVTPPAGSVILRPAGRVTVEHDVHGEVLDVRDARGRRLATVTERDWEAAQRDPAHRYALRVMLRSAGISSRECVDVFQAIGQTVRLRERQERDRLVLDPVGRPDVLTIVPRVRLGPRLRAFRRFSRIVLAHAVRDSAEVWRRERARRRWLREVGR